LEIEMPRPHALALPGTTGPGRRRPGGAGRGCPAGGGPPAGSDAGAGGPRRRPPAPAAGGTAVIRVVWQFAVCMSVFNKLHFAKCHLIRTARGQRFADPAGGPGPGLAGKSLPILRGAKALHQANLLTFSTLG